MFQLIEKKQLAVQKERKNNFSGRKIRAAHRPHPPVYQTVNPITQKVINLGT